MKFLRREVSNEQITELQKLHFETSMRERIVSNLIQNGADVSSNPAFQKYQTELAEVNAKYMELQSTIEHQILPTGFTSFYPCKWVIDFSSHLFILQIEDSAGIKVLENANYDLTDE